MSKLNYPVICAFLAMLIIAACARPAFTPAEIGGLGDAIMRHPEARRVDNQHHFDFEGEEKAYSLTVGGKEVAESIELYGHPKGDGYEGSFTAHDYDLDGVVDIGSITTSDGRETTFIRSMKGGPDGVFPAKNPECYEDLQTEFDVGLKAALQKLGPILPRYAPPVKAAKPAPAVDPAPVVAPKKSRPPKR